MKAVGFNRPLPIEHPDALLDIELPEPDIGTQDILGRVDIELTAKPKHLQPDKYWLQKMCPSSRNASLSF